MQNKPLTKGKIPDHELARILENYTHNNSSNKNHSRILLGPKLGEDAAIIDMYSPSGKNCLAVTVDPILVSIKNAPLYAVAINVNDIVTRGAVPKWAAASIFFPEGSTLLEVEQFFKELYVAIIPHDIALVTGHTEVTSSVKNAGIVLTLFGEVEKENIITTSGARIGDRILLTGGAGIEGTAIIADTLYAKSASSRLAGIPEEIIKRGREYLHDPGICIAEAAYLAWKYQPHALHDPTEGGVRKGIEEIAQASGNGVRIYHEKIPLRYETERLCAALDVDPLGIFGSGALLICIPPEKAKSLLAAYTQAGILAREIGEVTPADQGRIMFYEGKKNPLHASYTDGLIEKLM